MKGFEVLRARLPALCGLPLLLAVSALLLTFHADQDGFPLGFHGYLSSHGATITANLGPEHGWLMFERLQHDPDSGETVYKPYNRFPITSFLFLKLAALPFRSDPGAALVAMHQMMSLFLVAALLVAYRIFRHLGLSPAASGGAALLAFSNFYLLYYGDMIFVDTPTLFGCVLAMEGMVLHQKSGRTAPLLWRALVGVAFGWQVFAFLLPYTATLAVRSLRTPGRSLLRCPGMQTGLAALLLGGALLAANLWNEQRMTGKPLAELDTLQSAGKRLGAQTDWNSKHQDKLATGFFLRDQVERVGRITLPHALFPWPSPVGCFWVGILALMAGAVVCWKTPRRLLACTALFSGFVWALPLKHFVSFHEFQGLYYLGVPLLLSAALFAGLERGGGRWVSVAALLCGMLFAVGTVHLAYTKTLRSGMARAITEDFRTIRAVLPAGASYSMHHLPRELWHPAHGVQYYLPDRVVRLQGAEYRLDKRPSRFGETMTPGNRHVFLYRSSGIQ